MSILEPPATYDQARRDIWAATVEALKIRGRLFTTEPHVLAAYTEQVITNRRAAELLTQTDVLIMRNGKAAANPAVSLQRQSAAAIAQLARTLGLDRNPLTTPTVSAEPASPIGGARWCEHHNRSECTHHRVRCGHPSGSPVPPEGCCHQQNIRGTRSCYLHAGKALAQAKAEGAATLARIYTGAPLAIDPAAALLAELGYSAQAVSELRDRVALLAAEPGPDGQQGSGLFWGTVLEREKDGVTEREQRAGPHAILKALNEERAHLVHTAAAARATGAMEVQADAQRRMAGSLTRLLDAIFEGLQLTAYQRNELIPAIVPAAIRAWELDTPGGA